MLTNLGQELKKARKRRGASLQAIAIPAQITGAYLHKLEQGTIETPSPRVLHRLAIQLGVPYLRLMVLAEYLDEEHGVTLHPQPPSMPPLTDQPLTPAEWRAVKAYVELLVAQRDQGDT